MNSEQSANKILSNSFVEGGTETALPYLHIDENMFRLKALVYMTDVLDEDHGPFRYVKKSQTQLEPLDFIIRKSVDATGIDGQQLKARMVIYNLPKFFRRRANFGNDLLTDNPVASEISEQEMTCMAKAGTAVLFNTDGYHRGGLIRGNRFRKIIQVVFRPKAMPGATLA